MKISLIHPSRGRPDKSLDTFDRWNSYSSNYMADSEWILSLDVDDASAYRYTKNYIGSGVDAIIFNTNKSAVDAINNAARVAKGDVFIVVSDDTEPVQNWDIKILQEVEGKTDWILKTQDGIQPWIITMPVMDRAYYNRTGNIYDPSFDHMFCDTWLTVQADISGRKITSNLKFPHLNDSIKDELRQRTNGTWRQGEETFIRLIKSVPIEDLKKITDVAMKNWIRNKTGIRV